MDKNYDHKKYEEELYKKWEESGAFKAPSATEANRMGIKAFSIIMPPPNANDPLHIGHACFVAIEDALIRYHRLKGDASLWLPGTDHAGIETQFVFEKKLAKEGKSRFDFDRETLFTMIAEYVKENSGTATSQMKRIGASADWDRFKFTMDSDVVEMVIDTFLKLHKGGLIYRGQRLVNYCTKCGTSYSELEVEYEEREDKLYEIKYGEGVTVATTRPETMLGDVAVAVNAKDKRYKKLIGTTVRLPLSNRDIPIIEDAMVDVEFGTGAVKITPAHDHNDWAVAERQGWDMAEVVKKSQVIGMNGKMNSAAGHYEGMNILEAREKILNDLGSSLVNEKKITHNVGCCYRCHRAIEPLPLSQFFIKTRPLADRALKALDNKETIILGEGREKILRHWLSNIRDWNISRQIVWGIRIPVWYQKDDVIRSEYKVSKTCPGDGWVQETDTFDTWFSSGQWPVVTLKTNRDGDFEYYYPTTVMETGYDILPIWVMRMMLLGIYLTGKSPFKHVYLHGLVRDGQGRKMSKSIGNVINPLTVIDKYGADALRMALVMGTTPGNDSSVGEDKIRGMRNFSNKIWNAGRYVKDFSDQWEKTTNDLNADSVQNNTLKVSLEVGDNKFGFKLSEIQNEVTRLLDELKIGLAAERVYNEFWHWFCDEQIERAKTGMLSADKLRAGYATFLKLLHPFMPFVTEAVWKELGFEGLLISSRWSSTEK